MAGRLRGARAARSAGPRRRRAANERDEFAAPHVPLSLRITPPHRYRCADRALQKITRFASMPTCFHHARSSCRNRPAAVATGGIICMSLPRPHQRHCDRARRNALTGCSRLARRGAVGWSSRRGAFEVLFAPLRFAELPNTVTRIGFVALARDQIGKSFEPGTVDRAWTGKRDARPFIVFLTRSEGCGLSSPDASGDAMAAPWAGYSTARSRPGKRA